MTIDRSAWKLRGNVRALRIELAEWDRDGDGWRPAQVASEVTFDPAGRVVDRVHHNRDGNPVSETFRFDAAGKPLERQFVSAEGKATKWIYSYDDENRPLRTRLVEADGRERMLEENTYDGAGLRTKVESFPPVPPNTAFSYAIEGSETGHGANGAVTASVRYDEGGRARDAVLHDASGAVILSISVERDADGRPLVETAELAASSVPLDAVLAGSGPAEDRSQLAALISLAFGSTRIEFTYDARGRLIERARQIGRLSEERTTFTYDEHDNPLDESTISRNREMTLGDSGRLQATADTVRRQDIRFEYTYDARGNWTDRVVWMRFDADAPYHRSNVERRTIGYFEDATVDRPDTQR